MIRALPSQLRPSRSANRPGAQFRSEDSNLAEISPEASALPVSTFCLKPTKPHEDAGGSLYPFVPFLHVRRSSCRGNR